MMRFQKGRAVVEVNGEQTEIHCGQGSWPTFSDDGEHGGILMTSLDDVAAVYDALRVAMYTHVDEESLRSAACILGVTVEKE